MPTAPPTPDEGPAADDALAEALADAWVASAAHDPALRRAALRAAGLTKEPADMTLDELAVCHGSDRHALTRLALRTLRRLRHEPVIQALNSKY